MNKIVHVRVSMLLILFKKNESIVKIIEMVVYRMSMFSIALIGGN